MKRLYSTIVVGLALSLGFAPIAAVAQDHPKAASAKATKSRGDATAKDENIKQDAGPNDPNAKIPAPPDKGGPKTRGSYCLVDVDNRTPYYISVYTDGNYRGQVSPYGDLVGYVGCGNTRLYGKATFTDGSVQTFGPSVYYVDGKFTWSLTN